jgi:hypothetical protein
MERVPKVQGPLADLTDSLVKYRYWMIFNIPVLFKPCEPLRAFSYSYFSAIVCLGGS